MYIFEWFSIKQETPEFSDVRQVDNVVPYGNNTTGTKQLRWFAWPFELGLHFLCGVVHIIVLPYYYYQQLLIAATLAVLLHPLSRPQKPKEYVPPAIEIGHTEGLFNKPIHETIILD